MIAVSALPREVSLAPSPRVVDLRTPPQKPTADVLYDRMCVDGESFWAVVHDPFMSRDITRHDLRLIVARGLEQTRGSYKGLVQVFNIEERGYKRFLSFLRKHECHLPFQRFRALPVRVNTNATAIQESELAFAGAPGGGSLLRH